MSYHHCQFPGRCLMAGWHHPDECHTAEILEQYYEEAMSNPDTREAGEVTLDTSGPDVMERLLQILLGAASCLGDETAPVFQHTMDKQRVAMPADIFRRILAVQSTAQDLLVELANCGHAALAPPGAAAAPTGGAEGGR